MEKRDSRELTTRDLCTVIVTLAATMTFASCGAAGAGTGNDGRNAEVDRIFAKWTSSTPGCAVGVSKDGRATLTKAYGMADLEHDIRNMPETIFEAGSISKQFTAAAVLLLARDGKLSLDDPARKYIPELPDYGTPLSIRHMLTHTSGLRDWGAVAFSAPGLGTVVFRRDAAGRPTALSIVQDRVWDLRFTRK